MSASPIDLVLERLEGTKSEGKDRWKAMCPAHDGHRPALAVTVDANGKVALYCHNGCDTAVVLERLGLSFRDLSRRNGNGKSREIVATYDYTDEGGQLLYQVVRYAPKDFVQRRPNGGGGWIWSLDKDADKNPLPTPTRRVLYRLPAVLEAAAAGGIVYVVEGEKDVHAIEKAGAVATCNAGGASKNPARSTWRPEYSAALAGAHVILVADKDEPGRAHASAVAAALLPVAASVGVVQAKTGKDAADHLAAGNGLEQFVAMEPAAAKAEQPAPEERQCSDTGNALRVLAYCGDRVRYCAMERQWYIYDGRCWAQDKTLHIEDLAGEALRGIYAEASEAADEKRRTELGRWAISSEAAIRRRNAVEMARSRRECAVLPEVFDVNPHALNCLSGTIDLRTGKAHRQDPRDMISMLAPVRHEPGARSELWERVVLEACGGDEEYAAYLQRFYGYACSGENIEEIIAIQAGPTLTAKTTINEAIKATLGTYAATVDAETLTRQKFGSATRNDVLQLNGKRLAVSGEATRGEAFDVSFLKAFTGEFTMKKRALYHADQEFHPTAQLVLHTNEIPRLPSDDDAVWRRVHVQPFTHKPEKIDTTYKPLLRNVDVSGAAILAWLVKGYGEWQRLGLAPPPVVQGASRALRAEMDQLAEWLADCCELEAGVWTSNRVLRDSYDAWAKRYGVKGLTPKEWGMSLRAHGMESKKREHGMRGWVGLRMSEAAEVEQELEL